MPRAANEDSAAQHADTRWPPARGRREARVRVLCEERRRVRPSRLGSSRRDPRPLASDGGRATLSAGSCTPAAPPPARLRARSRRRGHSRAHPGARAPGRNGNRHERGPCHRPRAALTRRHAAHGLGARCDPRHRRHGGALGAHHEPARRGRLGPQPGQPSRRRARRPRVHAVPPTALRSRAARGFLVTRRCAARARSSSIPGRRFVDYSRARRVALASHGARATGEAAVGSNACVEWSPSPHRGRARRGRARPQAHLLPVAPAAPTRGGSQRTRGALLSLAGLYAVCEARAPASGERLPLIARRCLVFGRRPHWRHRRAYRRRSRRRVRSQCRRSRRGTPPRSGATPACP